YHLHNYCDLDLARFYRLVQPQWKIGTRFELGPRPFFNYVFGFELDTNYHVVPRSTGYYVSATDPFVNTGLQSRLIYETRIGVRPPDGSPRLNAAEFAYHLEHDNLASYLETIVRERGIPIVDDGAVHVGQGDGGVTGLRLESGATMTADLYIDASGSQSLLL